MIVVLLLTGCSKKEGYESEKIAENLVNKGISQNAIRESEKELYDEIYISDRDMGCAKIYVYKSASDAKNYWDNLGEKYNNLNYLDNATAVGDLKDVCDVSIEEWIHIDGTKVSEVETPNAQREKASELENIIMNSMK